MIISDYSRLSYLKQALLRPFTMKILLGTGRLRGKYIDPHRSYHLTTFTEPNHKNGKNHHPTSPKTI